MELKTACENREENICKSRKKFHNIGGKVLIVKPWPQTPHCKDDLCIILLLNASSLVMIMIIVLTH